MYNAHTRSRRSPLDAQSTSCDLSPSENKQMINSKKDDKKFVRGGGLSLYEGYEY